MKHCPTCNSDFADNDLAFCTNDGTALVPADASTIAESQVTELFKSVPDTRVMSAARPTDPAGAEEVSPAQAPQPYGWANDVAPVWTPPPPPPRPFVSQQQTLAVISLVSGVAAITIGWICGGPLFALVAVTLGVVALIQVKRNPSQYSGKPFAWGGIATGAIVLLIYFVLALIWVVFMFAGAASR